MDSINPGHPLVEMKWFPSWKLFRDAPTLRLSYYILPYTSHRSQVVAVTTQAGSRLKNYDKYDKSCNKILPHQATSGTTHYSKEWGWNFPCSIPISHYWHRLLVPNLGSTWTIPIFVNVQNLAQFLNYKTSKILRFEFFRIFFQIPS